MTARVFSAPGKAVLCGEYAVLRGAPAVAIAVDRRAKVTMAIPGADIGCVRMPGHLDGVWRYLLDDDGGPAWIDRKPGAGLALVEAVFAACRADLDRPFDLTVDSRAFSDTATGRKLGLGSSAAAAVALSAALTPAGAGPTTIWRRARAAHERLQSGKGSGVDVAASAVGGLIVYQRDAAELPERLAWPGELSCRFVFSGRAASTTEAIARAENAGRRHWVSLGAAAEAAASAWREGRAMNIIEAVDNYASELKEFDDASGAGIFRAGHGEALRRARATGVVYKPCGAGGGDIGIALAVGEDRLDAFVEESTELGFTALDLSIDELGVAATGATAD